MTEERRLRVRWAQRGYGRTSSTSRTQTAPRNLFGFKDGTANLMAEELDELDRHVWVAAADDPGHPGSPVARSSPRDGSE